MITIVTGKYMVREHLVERGGEHLRKAGHGMINPEEMLYLRWNSQVFKYTLT
jgi:hypothetical protein